MTSQTDLDQGGTFRQTKRVYMGPSVGWVWAADEVVLPIITAGATQASRGNSLITFNVAAAAEVQLWSTLGSIAGPQAIPGSYVIVPVTIVDIGGNASTFNKRITAFPGEFIDGLASIDIAGDYGAYVLRPRTPLAGWTLG